MVQPASKSPHSLESWVFGYTNAGGNPDNVKVEINYSDRCYVFPTQTTQTSIRFLDDTMFRTLHPIELFASKNNALVDKASMRDVYDVHNMITHGHFASQQERDLLCKTFVFYHAVGHQARQKTCRCNLRHSPKSNP